MIAYGVFCLVLGAVLAAALLWTIANDIQKWLDGMKAVLFLACLSICVKASAATIPGQQLGHFETSSDGTVVTTTILTNSFTGSRYGAWETLSDPSQQTDGPIPNATISTLASFPLFTPASINGVPQDPATTKGIKFNMGQNGACQWNMSGNGLPISVGFFLNFHGNQVNQSPRDVFGLRPDYTGGFQFLQLYDGPSPYFHAHWQPNGGSNIGNDVNISRNHWYWFTMQSAIGGGTFRVSCYDAENGFALIGTSTGAVTSGTVKITTVQFGMVQYGDSTESGQDLYLDNIIVNTNNVFPLGPGGGPLVASTNRIDWTTAGIPGGIPDSSTMTIFQTLNAGATVSQIQTALNNCPSNQVVKLGPGTFQVGATGLTVPSGVVLKGSGSNATFIASAIANTAQGGITMSSEWITGNNTIINVRSGYTQGSSNLVLNAANASLHAGFVMTIEQTNDGKFVYNGPATPGGFLRTDITPLSDGTQCLSQTTKIISISNNTNLVIWPPLYWTYTAGLNPNIVYRPSTSPTINYCTRAGVENLCVSNYDGNGNCIEFNRAYQCWVKDCRTINAGVYHIALYRSLQCNIFENSCEGTLDSTASNGYGIDCEYQSCANLIENNIIYANRDFIKCNSGSSGNVVIYNYHTNAVANPDAPNFAVHTGGAHSAHPMMNLFEGNISYKPVFDFYWGSGSHETIARNWWRGPVWAYSSQSLAALIIDTTNVYYNVVGNILGTPNITTNTTRAASFSILKISPATHNYGNPLPGTPVGQYTSIRIGYPSDGDSGGGLNGTNQWNTHTVNGNFDYVNGVQNNFNPSTAEFIPSSYFYTSKPSYFGSMAWPPMNPATGTVSETNMIPAGLRFVTGSSQGGPPDPNITAQPSSQTVYAGQTATFSVTASGGSTLSYQWNWYGTNVTGATSSSWTTPATVSGNNGSSVFVTVSDIAGSVQSVTVTLSVTPDPHISAQPQDVTVASGNPTTFSVTADGATTLSYQWQLSVNGGSTWNNISNGGVYSTATTSTLNISDVTGLNSNKYRVAVTDTAGTLNSSAATLTVTGGGPNNPPATITGAMLWGVTLR